MVINKHSWGFTMYRLVITYTSAHPHYPSIISTVYRGGKGGSKEFVQLEIVNSRIWTQDRLISKPILLLQNQEAPERSSDDSNITYWAERRRQQEQQMIREEGTLHGIRGRGFPMELYRVDNSSLKHQPVPVCAC